MAGFSFGDMLLNMTGHSNPQDMLARMALTSGGLPGATPTTPPAAGPTPAAGPGAPGTSTPAAPPQPAAYTSPPDLLSLYSQLVDRQQKRDQINRGIDLIAAGFAHPDNRSAIMQQAGQVGAGNTDPLQLVMGIQQQQNALAIKNDQLKQLPNIAAKYNLSLDQIKELWQNGKLDDFIMQQEKPNLTTMADGKGVLQTIDQRTGTALGTGVGAPKIETQVVHNDATGVDTLIDKNTGNPVAGLGGGLKPTADMQNLQQVNSERLAAGKWPISAEDWMKLQNQSKTTTVNMNNNEVNTKLQEAFDTNLVKDGDSAANSVKTLQTIQDARQSLNAPGGIISGSAISPYEQSGRKMLAGIFGLPDDATVNTDAYQAAMKNIVLPRVHQLGTGNSISDADVKFIEQATGGDLSLTQGAANHILAIMEKGERNEIAKYNAKLQERIAASADPVTGKVPPALAASAKPIPIPPLSDEFKKDAVMGVPDPAVKDLIQYAKGPQRDQAIKDFDAKFGTGKAANILEAFGG